MGTTEADRLRARLRAFAVRIVKFARALPPDGSAQAIARQLTKAGTGTSANYHSACRGRSRAEFIARLAVALDEADEACMWLEVIKDSDIARGEELEWLIGESGELRAILFASVNTARMNQQRTSQILRFSLINW
jgi:four helix bundle protein